MLQFSTTILTQKILGICEKELHNLREQLRIPIYKERLLLETQQILEDSCRIHKHGTSEGLRE